MFVCLQLSYLHADVFKNLSAKETKKHFVDFYNNFLDKGAVSECYLLTLTKSTDLLSHLFIRSLFLVLCHVCFYSTSISAFGLSPYLHQNVPSSGPDSPCSQTFSFVLVFY